MHGHTRIKYGGTALPADSDTETLFDTTAFAHPSSGVFQQGGWRYFNFKVDHSHKGTIVADLSDDGGASWSQFWSHALAPHHADIMNFNHIPIVEGVDFRVRWVNGGTTQTTFKPFLTLSQQEDFKGEWPLMLPDYVSGGDVDTTQNFSWIPVGPGGHVTMDIAVTSGSSPNGTWKLEGTKNGGTTAIEVGGSSTEFTDLTGSNETFDCNWYNLPEGSFVRLVYTRSSGTGTLNVSAHSY